MKPKAIKPNQYEYKPNQYEYRAFGQLKTGCRVHDYVRRTKVLDDGTIWESSTLVCLVCNATRDVDPDDVFDEAGCLMRDA